VTTGIALLLLLQTAACSTVGYRSRFESPDRLDAQSPPPGEAIFAKCYLNDGRLYVLDQWTFDREAGTIRGHGIRYGVDREIGDKGAFVFSISEVATLEVVRAERVWRDAVNIPILVTAVIVLAAGAFIGIGIARGMGNIK
jgi:hypothetical protein